MVVDASVLQVRDKDNAEGKPYKCLYPECGKCFYEKHNLIRHIKDKHKDAVARDCVGQNEAYRASETGVGRGNQSDSSVDKESSGDHTSFDEANVKVSQNTGDAASNLSLQDANLLKAFGFMVSTEDKKQTVKEEEPHVNTRNWPESDALATFGGYYMPVSDATETSECNEKNETANPLKDTGQDLKVFKQ